MALFMENNPRFLEVCWAALRSGLYITAINRYMTLDEAAAIMDVAAGTIKSRTSRARAALKKTLAAHARDLGFAGRRP